MLPNVKTPDDAIAYLRQNHAQSGAVEAAFAFDGDTGILLDFATGTEESVDLNEEKLRHCTNVILLHSHPVNAAAAQHDWQYFVQQDNQRQFIVVGPTSTYFLVKPPDWQPAGQWRRNPFDDWEDHAVNVLHQQGISSFYLPTPEEWEAATVEINRRMARQYGIHFSWQNKEQLP